MSTDQLAHAASIQRAKDIMDAAKAEYDRAAAAFAEVKEQNTAILRESDLAAQTRQKIAKPKSTAVTKPAAAAKPATVPSRWQPFSVRSHPEYRNGGDNDSEH